MKIQNILITCALACGFFATQSALASLELSTDASIQAAAGGGQWTDLIPSGPDASLASASQALGVAKTFDNIDSPSGPDSVNCPPAVPEPTTVIAGALLLLPFGASVVRGLRKGRKA